MQALEVETFIDDKHQIHLQLPEHVHTGKAKVIVLFESRKTTANKPLKLGLLEGKITISDDFT